MLVSFILIRLIVLLLVSLRGSLLHLFALGFFARLSNLLNEVLDDGPVLVHCNVQLLRPASRLNRVCGHDEVTAVVLHVLPRDKGEFDQVDLSEQGLDEPATHLEAVVGDLARQATNETILDCATPVRPLQVVLVKGIDVLELTLAVRLELAGVGMHGAADANLQLFLALLRLRVLDLPHLVDVAMTSGDLVFLFDKRIVFLERSVLGVVLAARVVQPGIVDLLSLFHERANTVNCVVCLWLVLERSLANRLVVQNVRFRLLIVLLTPLVDEDFAIVDLDFQVPGVVGLRGAHEDGRDLLCGIDVSRIILDHLTHRRVVKQACVEGRVPWLELRQCLRLLATRPVPFGFVLRDVTTFLCVVQRHWPQGRKSIKVLPCVLLEELPLASDVDGEVAQIGTQHPRVVAGPEVLTSLLLLRLTFHILTLALSVLVEATTLLLEILLVYVRFLLAILSNIRPLVVVLISHALLLFFLLTVTTLSRDSEIVVIVFLGLVHGVGFLGRFLLLLLDISCGFPLLLLLLVLSLTLLFFGALNRGCQEIRDFAQFGAFVDREEKLAIAAFPVLVRLNLLFARSKRILLLRIESWAFGLLGLLQCCVDVEKHHVQLVNFD